MIRLLRWPFEQVGAFIDNLLPAAEDLRARVQLAREERQGREADELFEFFQQGADRRHPSPGVVSDGPLPTAPAPGEPHFERYYLDRFVQADNKFQK
ncbi:hypothetical protein [Mycolicibacterium llatzerense]|uniref:Uncharacterized protein n=1 Tax=Mycolicibacterium llatzerense TaxID=280871 RepID=A0A0D1JZ00_9MYCO|nr:hypothetical protein [Mycolicibacterium llatzerense]KIU17879.1 hypothetical protein TL10_06370 [Mycolicibacterium llatzerense]